MRISEIISESIFYKGDFKAPYSSIDNDIVILENPSKSDLDRFFFKQRSPELRGLMGSTLYVWDSYIASHDDVEKVFKLEGVAIFLYEGYIMVNDYYLRHPDLKQEITEVVQNDQNIFRIYGKVVPKIRNSCFVFETE